MLNWDERRLIVRIAKLYYFDGWTQAEIAKKVGVSRPVISKLLQKAKDHGIVEIYIKDDTVHTIELEHMLEKSFGLKEVIVVPTIGLTPEMVKQAVGKAGAYYVARNLKNVKTLGISWGTTLYYLVQEYPFERRPDIKIIPLVGGMGREKVEIHANQLAYELAKKMNCKCEFLYAPAIVETEDLRDRLIQSTDIAAVLEEGKSVDMAIVGIGNPYKQSTMEEIGYLKSEDLHELKMTGVVGDIGSRFFDAEGKQVNHSLNNKVIGLDLDHLRQINEVVGVVTGTHKLDSILAALRGKHLDVLITDDQMAYALTNEL